MTYGDIAQYRRQQQHARAAVTLWAIGLAALFVACCLALGVGGCTAYTLYTPVVDMSMDVRFHLPAFVQTMLEECPEPVASPTVTEEAPEP